MNERFVIVTLRQLQLEEWTEVQSLANVQNHVQGWRHHYEHEDHHQYLCDKMHIHEDVDGVLARDEAYDPPTEVVVLRNGSDNHSNSRIREPWKNKDEKLSSVAISMRFLST